MSGIEVAGLVIGIVGLHAACQSCYRVFTKIKDAKHDVSLTLSRLEIQELVLEAWLWHWGIHQGQQLTEGEAARTTLFQYLQTNLPAAYGIVNVLYCTSQLLLDHAKHRENYAQWTNTAGESNLPELPPPPGQPALGVKQLAAEVKERTDVLKKRSSAIVQRFGRGITWAFKDGKKFDKLIQQLIEFNTSLYQLAPQSARDVLPVTLVSVYMRHNPSLDHDPTPRVLSDTDMPDMDLSDTNIPTTNTPDTSGSCTCGSDTSISDTSVSDTNVSSTDAPNTNEPNTNVPDANLSDTDNQVGANPSPVQNAIGVLNDFIALRQAVRDNGLEKSLTPEEEEELLSIKPDDLQIPVQKDTTNMAILRLGQPEAVLIEKQSCKYGDDDQQKQIRSNTLKLGRLFRHVPVFQRHLHSLELIGMVEFEQKKEIGFVYQLPRDLGKRKPGYPVADLEIRRPRSLDRLLDPFDNGKNQPPLHQRFELAQKLVRSLAYLHACGWLHKNVRSKAVYFFPKRSGPELDQYTGVVDLETPFLTGHLYARPDVSSPKQSLTSTQPMSPQNRSSYVGTNHHRLGHRGVDDPQSHRLLDVPLGAELLDHDAPSRPNNKRQHDEAKVENFARYSDDEIVRGTADFPGGDFLNRLRHLRDIKRAINPDIDRKGPVIRLSKEPGRITLDYYQHPFKCTYPESAYCYAFDVYSLGVTLFEIGCWRRLTAFVMNHDQKDHFETRRNLVSRAKKELPWACGDIYTQVVVSCLSVEQDDSEGETRELCARILDDLAQLRV
ncbi:hypothetical protein VTJ04DRAFT_9302 [Mycothermus thermophilus]|uniref:uncharacterized protein n=1 Tax=Humicola insolens TaxID=85995 RepID=UPI003742B2BF